MKLGEFMNLFAEFRASSWNGWREVLARISGSTREFYAVVGRGAGKSRMVALIACAFATREYERAPGEYVYVGVFGPTKAQAAITYRYIRGLFRSVSQLEGLIIGEKAHSLELSNHVVIEVITATVASPRGRAYALVILEEAAFLPQDRSVNPDVELLRAVRPALARVPGSLLCVVSSPYARRGIIWEAFKRHQNNEDGRVVYVQAPTLDLNPTFDRSAVDLALEEDPAGARAEYLAEFRRDIESYASREAIEACVIPARRPSPLLAARSPLWHSSGTYRQLPDRLCPRYITESASAVAISWRSESHGREQLLPSLQFFFAGVQHDDIEPFIRTPEPVQADIAKAGLQTVDKSRRPVGAGKSDNEQSVLV